MSEQDEHDHDGGLRVDLPRLLARRRVLTLLAGAGMAAVAGCASAAPTSTTGSSGEIPQETAGPFPGDGSNGPNVLTESGVVRSDIRSSFGSLSGTAAGVPLTIELLVVDAANGGVPLPGAALYLWHCDREGRYSLYEREDQNYLRGVQQADAAGLVRFTTVVPGAYAGRWPHAHFEVHPDLAAATSGSTAITTSQLALPKEVCDQVYATDGYAASIPNLARTSLDSDGVFGDGYASQLATVTGTVASGLTARLTVPVEA
ncbi:intradiol ring-cleavage dioxygenase [Actinomycetes bacterium KLBMP 9759]